MGNLKLELKEECLRLRVEESKSFLDIVALTGVSKGSLSAWLKPYPLPDVLVKERQKAVVRYRTPKKDRGEESSIHRVVKHNGLTPLQLSKVAEAAVMLRMLSHGFNVFGSVFDGDRTDWVVEVSSTGKVWKVQVKLASRGQGMPLVSIRDGRHRRYNTGDFDFLVGYDLFTDTAYVWSWAEVSHLKTAVAITDDAEERWDKLNVRS